MVAVPCCYIFHTATSKLEIFPMENLNCLPEESLAAVMDLPIQKIMSYKFYPILVVESMHTFCMAFWLLPVFFTMRKPVAQELRSPPPLLITHGKDLTLSPSSGDLGKWSDSSCYPNQSVKLQPLQLQSRDLSTPG